MIQLYKAENKSFECNGDMTLIPSKATVHVVMNGAWETEIEHPIDKEERWRYIKENAVVKMPSFNGEQLFRIKKKRKSDSGVAATLEPFFFYAKDDCFLRDIRPTKKNGQQALDIMTSPNNKYTGKSNITILSTAYYEYMNLIEAINGNQDNSFVNRWGGEILFDNFTVVINDRIGIDNGVELRYGKNISVDGLSEEIDVNAVATRIYPKAFNGHKLSGTGYIDSDLIGKYPVVKSVTMSFEDVKMISDIQGENDTEGIIICNNQEELDDALIKKCKEQFDSGLDKPVVTIEADMILLKNTEQYKDYVILEDVSLGDTIHCRNSNLEIVTDARVIELEYDSIRQKVTSVVLGSFQYNYFNDVSGMINRVEGAIRGDGTVVATQVQGILDAVKTQMRAQSTIAKKQNVRAMLFEDLDPDSETFGAMCLGTMGFQIARERTADGRDWNWTTFGTGKGFFADYIVAGTMLADRIYGGTLTLGGYNNQNGRMTIQDASGNEIGRWDSKGFSASGRFESKNTSDGSSVIVENGYIYIKNKAGKVTGAISYINGGITIDVLVGSNPPRLTLSENGNIMLVNDNGKGSCSIGGGEFLSLSADNISISGGKTGTAEFSDGSYLQFKSGILVGGRTASGSTF
jgi:phage minor structural protein